MATDRLVQTLDFDEALHILIDGATDLLGVERASIMMIEKETQSLSIRVAKGISGDVIADTRIPIGEGIAGGVAQRGEPLIIQDVRELSDWSTQEASPRTGYEDYSAMSVPLSIHGEVRGVMNFNNKKNHRTFEESDLQFAQLIANQAAAVLYSAALHRHFTDNLAIENELRIARTIQERFLPSDPPNLPGFELSASCLMCSHVGGDYYDFFSLDESRMAVIIGDVAGHGVGSALMMANARAFLRSCLARGTDIEDSLRQLNDFLVMDMASESFMTMILGVLDRRTRSFRFANAGHRAPFYVGQGEFKIGPAGANFPLGVVDKWQFVADRPVYFETGDLLVLSTDGVWEAVDPSGQQFGDDRVDTLLADFSGESGEKAISAIFDEVRRHCAGGFQQDDYTLVSIRAV